MIEDDIKQVIANQLSVRLEEVTDVAKLTVDLGGDSLDAVEIIMALEEDFGIEITDQEAEKAVTVLDVIDMVKKELGEGQ